MRRVRFLAVAVLAAGLAGSCTTKEPSLYDRLGGTPGIAAVVDDFVANIAADTAINRRFAGSDIPKLKRLLVEQICQAAGGPCKYSGRSMAESHRGMAITDADFNSMANDMTKTLDKFNVPAREKGEVLKLLSSMRGDIVGR
jgi:hemoglobin